MKSHIREKIQYILPIDNFPSLVLLRIAIILQHLIIQFPLYYLSSGSLREVQKNFKLLALKVVEVAYERWSLKRGSKYNDLEFFGFLENWSLRRGGRVMKGERGGRGGGGGRWSQPEAQLYFYYLLRPDTMQFTF